MIKWPRYKDVYSIRGELALVLPAPSSAATTGSTEPRPQPGISGHRSRQPDVVRRDSRSSPRSFPLSRMISEEAFDRTLRFLDGAPVSLGSIQSEASRETTF